MTCDKKTEYTFTMSEEEARALFIVVQEAITPEAAFKPEHKKAVLPLFNFFCQEIME
jgi:hypothetical protein